MIADFVALAQDCATADAFEVGALELVGQAVGFEAAFFMVKGNERFATMLGLDAATRALASARGETYAEELLPVKRAALAARGVAVDTEVCGAAHVRKTNYYREVASTVGGQHTLMAYLPWRGGVAAAMMLGRGGKGFSQQEQTLLESLLPTLGVARATYGFPLTLEPLPPPPTRSLLGRLGLGRSSQVLASVGTGSGRLIVRDRDGFREMVASDGTSELVWTRVSLKDSGTSGWPYVDLFHLAPALAKQRRRALFVGSGGAVGVRQFASAYPGIAIDLVEHEPAVIELARAWFDLGAIPGVAVHIADGARFIREAAPSSWDVVVIDAYDASISSTAFSGDEFLAALRRVLRPGGTVACNIIGALAGEGPVRNFVASAKAVFDAVRIVPVVESYESFSGDTLRNVVVVARRVD
jgi:spermidine synthase